MFESWAPRGAQKVWLRGYTNHHLAQKVSDWRHPVNPCMFLYLIFVISLYFGNMPLGVHLTQEERGRIQELRESDVKLPAVPTFTGRLDFLQKKIEKNTPKYS